MLSVWWLTVGRVLSCCSNFSLNVFCSHDGVCCVSPRYQKEMATYIAKKAAEAPDEEGSGEESE